MFQTLYEAHEDIEKLIKKNDYENVQILLEGCQNMAIQMGTSIEASEGEKCVTIDFLEEYCETLYNVSVNLNNSYNGNKIQKILNRKLIKVENSVKNDIKVRLEIVFCPYKASMWDSLESVWKAADEDPDCDAYVVPIPYYDRNFDSSFREFHYEGGEFPDYVPIVSYKAYNFETRKPDAIYIHNPYDDGNLVTSVDPRYYSRELKKYTDCLVYIPYCVYDEPHNLTEQNALEFFERYITPVMFHADWIIFQSENFSTTFIETISACTNTSKNIWNAKILSLGSPKFDKASSSVARLSIDETWRNKIFCVDGTKKKVIFYNTSIGMLLKYDEKMIDKISNVIAYFEQHQDKYLLLWRPHPLIEATIKSMRPNLWKEYKHIVEEYKRKDIGIYDDTPDYGMGFALSDAYYGDFSSLVQLYQASGKMLLQQDVRVRNCYNSLDYVVSDNMYYDGEYIWATAMNYNGVYRIDPITFYAEYIGTFPNEDFNGYYLYFGIEEKNNKLYFSPYNAGSIGILDKNTLQISTVKVKSQNSPLKRNYYGSSNIDNQIIIAEHEHNTILKMNIQTMEVNYINVCELFPHTIFDKTDILVRHLCKCNGMLFTISPTKKALLKFDLKNRTAKWLPLPDSLVDCSDLEYATIYSDDKSLWLFQPKQEYVLRLDPLTGKVIQNIAFAKGAIFVKVGRFVYLFSYERDICCKVDSNTQEYTMIDVGVKAENAFNFNDKIILVNSYEKDITIFNTTTFEYIKMPIRSEHINSELYSISQMFKSYEKQYDYTRESAFYNLELLLKGIHTDSLNTDSEISEPIGAKIYKTIKEYNGLIN